MCVIYHDQVPHIGSTQCNIVIVQYMVRVVTLWGEYKYTIHKAVAVFADAQ